MPNPLKQSKALCIAIKEAINDERAASSMYNELKKQLKSEGLLTRAREYVIDEIIKEEENHERTAVLLAKQTGCELSTVEPTRELYSDLPLKERIKLARGFVSKAKSDIYE